MANHPNRGGKFELTFWGGAGGAKYRRHHATIDAARAEALRVLADMSNRGAHPAIIYGPGLGRDGVTLV